MISYNAQSYTENSGINNTNLDLTNSNPWNIGSIGINTHIQNNVYGYSSAYIPYSEYRKDTEEILEMFTDAAKELSEREHELIKNKFYELFINKKIKITIEINDEEKI